MTGAIGTGAIVPTACTCSCVHVPSVNHSLHTTFKTNQENTTWLYTKTSERNALIDVYLHSIQIKMAHYCT